MPSSSVSVRRSIRWVPEPASEPTDTLVLTGGKTGVFLDVRFIKGTSTLDWAFAGYRHQLPDGRVQFAHHIDSRTLDALSVKDIGNNKELEDGATLEIGEMVNPETGLLTPYEEIWEDKPLGASEPPASTFLCNASKTAWHAQVDRYQLALGRRADGRFWAWQAEKNSQDWNIIHSTHDKQVDFLPQERTSGWTEGAKIDWNGDVWDVVELVNF